MSAYQDRAKIVLEQFRNYELQAAGGRYLNNGPQLTLDQALSELASIVEEERINGARDFVKWGYGDLCETKDTDDFPDMKDDPLANRCASCEEWENFEDWKRDQLSNRNKSDE